MRASHTLLGLYLLLAGAPVFGGSRLNLPQVSAEVKLNPREVQSIFDLQADRNARALPGKLTQLIMDSLPASFLRGCQDMVVDFGPTAIPKTTWAWSGRVLHTEIDKSVQSALLALRCTVHVPDVTYFDERFALLLNNGQESVLKLVALDKDCTDCTSLYHLEFRQRFGTDNGYLAELTVEHTTDHPCCDGGDRDSGTRLLLMAIPSGVVAMTFDEETYSYNHDDENGDGETQCDSVVTYERNGDRLQGVTSKTSCKENGEVRRSVTVNHYLWSRSKEVFVESINTSSHNFPRQ